MKIVTGIGLDLIKLEGLKQKLAAIASTIDSAAPQINKNRRIRNLLKMAEKEVAEMIVTHTEEVSDG
jgi:hypothetical protein